jgi:hypothetical protein
VKFHCFLETTEKNQGLNPTIETIEPMSSDRELKWRRKFNLRRRDPGQNAVWQSYPTREIEVT